MGGRLSTEPIREHRGRVKTKTRPIQARPALGHRRPPPRADLQPRGRGQTPGLPGPGQPGEEGAPFTPQKDKAERKIRGLYFRSPPLLPDPNIDIKE